ncbi:hypothetical protein ASH02_13830 [Nocardioides sp. Soil796]|nr:hypothetical protein ASH02_13830 [Nocardioides sp. Soil796]
MLAHTRIEQVHAAGTVGVTMFFTLSGFLITALLLEERKHNGRVSLRKFYARRALRLLPALCLFLGAIGLMATSLDSPVVPSTTDFLGALFYVGNYTSAIHGHDTLIFHTWSLAVEEQFYIVWPLILIVVMRWGGRRLLVGIAGAGAALAVLIRGYLYLAGADGFRLAFSTDSRMDGLLVGCLAAAWMTGRTPGRNRPVLASVALVGACTLSLVGLKSELLFVTTLVPWLTACSILLLVQQSHEGLLTTWPMRILGQRSYAVYLWHYPIFSMAAAVAWPWTLVGFLVAGVITAGIAHLSWRCVEEPFLRLKERRARSGAHQEEVVGAAV